MDPIVFAKLRISCATKLLPVQVETQQSFKNKCINPHKSLTRIKYAESNICAKVFSLPLKWKYRQTCGKHLKVCYATDFILWNKFNFISIHFRQSTFFNHNYVENAKTASKSPSLKRSLLTVIPAKLERYQNHKSQNQERSHILPRKCQALRAKEAHPTGINTSPATEATAAARSSHKFTFNTTMSQALLV